MKYKVQLFTVLEREEIIIHEILSGYATIEHGFLKYFEADGNTCNYINAANYSRIRVEYIGEK